MYQLNTSVAPPTAEGVRAMTTGPADVQTSQNRAKERQLNKYRKRKEMGSSLSKVEEDGEEIQ